MIFPDLVKSSTRPVLAHTFWWKFDWISVINEDRNDGCCLVHAINTADGSSLNDRCFRDYRLCYKYRDHSYKRVTFAISESYRAIWRDFPVQRYSSYRVLVFPNFAAIASPEYCTEWFLSEMEPLEYIVKRFQSGGLVSAMTTPPKGVKIGTSQVRQMPRMRSQAQIVEDPNLE